MKLYCETFKIPTGEFSVAVDDAGALVGTAFGGIDMLVRYAPEGTVLAGAAHTRDVREQVLAYFAGERQEFRLAVAPQGTPFQLRVWKGLMEIPYGETRSYGQLAASLGKPGAARAVGSANGANPICLIIPCHRVINADGSIGGFGFGIELKRRLLDHEQAAGPAAGAGISSRAVRPR